MTAIPRSWADEDLLAAIRLIAPAVTDPQRMVFILNAQKSPSGALRWVPAVSVADVIQAALRRDLTRSRAMIPAASGADIDPPRIFVEARRRVGGCEAVSRKEIALAEWDEARTPGMLAEVAINEALAALGRARP